jgi:hypothetical protein
VVVERLADQNLFQKQGVCESVWKKSYLLIEPISKRKASEQLIESVSKSEVYQSGWEIVEHSYAGKLITEGD